MAPVRALLSSIVLAIALSGVSAATPFSGSTHHIREVGSRGLKFEAYYPPTTYQVCCLLYMAADDFADPIADLRDWC